MPSKDQAKSALKGFGNGLLSAASFVGDLSSLTRMTEIEGEIDKLQEEYAKLNERLESSHKRDVPYKK